MSECTHDCSTCSATCPSRQPSKEDFIEKLNDLSSVRKVIGVVSGKGGVGKSLVTSMLAVTFNRRDSTRNPRTVSTSPGLQTARHRGRGDGTAARPLCARFRPTAVRCGSAPTDGGRRRNAEGPRAGGVPIPYTPSMTSGVSPGSASTVTV